MDDMMASGTQAAATSVEGRTPSLSPRQREVLELLATGMPPKEAAAVLGLRLHSVRKLAATAYARVGGSGLVGTLYRLGWVVPR